MVSRRNFLSIIMMMAVLLFMCQFSQVIKESRSAYDVNSYVIDQKLSGKDRWMPSIGQSEADYEEGDFVIFLGKEDSAMGQVVAQWCLYTKRNLVVYNNYKDYRFTTQHKPEAVLVDSAVVDLAQGAITFEAITHSGVTMIFCNLPKPAAIDRNSMLKRLMGIRFVSAESIEVEGVHLFGDFLLGGEAFYRTENEDDEDEELQDMNLIMPWYVTTGGTKTYMVGMLDELLKDNEARNEFFPALIWRSNYNEGKVFVVNGDFLESTIGIGILDAIMYEDNSYVIYPVTNAQNVMVANFPGFAGENDSQMMALYSRNTESVIRDVFWPTISGMVDRNRYHLTCLMTPQYNYSDSIEPSGSTIPFYLQQFKEFSTEAGLSLEKWNDTTLREKLRNDGTFYLSQSEQYAYSALFVDNEDLEELRELMPFQSFLRDVNTVVREYQKTEPLVDYYDDDITLQSSTVEAQIHTFSDDFRMRCMETALGYSNILLDMNQVIWPESEDDQWEVVSEKIVSNLDTYWKPFTAFDNTSLSESDDRIRVLLNLDYEHRREDDTVYLDMTGVEEGWFIFRVHGERISDMEGGEYREIESGAYVIHAQQGHVKITVEKSRGLLNYDVE